LANAGVSLEGMSLSTLASPVTLGVAAGLVLGKQLGITLTGWVAVQLRLAKMPDGVRWIDIYGVSWLAGVGFTMSLLIADLAFDEATLMSEAKVGILGGSLIAGVVGYFILRRFLPEEAATQHET
jgi:NhaA family Na+:H+ antiporter